MQNLSSNTILFLNYSSFTPELSYHLQIKRAIGSFTRFLIYNIPSQWSSLTKPIFKVTVLDGKVFLTRNIAIKRDNSCERRGENAVFFVPSVLYAGRNIKVERICALGPISEVI